MVPHRCHEAQPRDPRRRPEDESGRPMSFSGQVIEAEAHGLGNVRTDSGQPREAVGAGPDQDEGQAEGMERLGAVCDRVDDRPVHPGAHERAQMASLPIGLPVRGEAQERELLLDGAVLRALGHLGPERVRDVGDDEPDEARAARAHGHCEVVGLVAQRPGRLDRPLASLGRDRPAAREGAGGRALGQSGQNGDIVDRRTLAVHRLPPARRLPRVWWERYHRLRPGQARMSPAPWPA